MEKIVGLDVGGAHLKVACIENGRLASAAQFVCPLWQGADKLTAALEASSHLTGDADLIAITMTAELSDFYDNRRAGVLDILGRMHAIFGANARIWQGTHGFGSVEQARANHAHVGSANFLATAQFASPTICDGFLIDMGSTTTDIVPIANGKPVPTALTDETRLASGELVYTGLTRTAVMAITGRVPFKGRWQPLMREYLATMADVRRIIGNLPEGLDQHATADGRGKSRPESIARLARMLGCDAEDATDQEWTAVAGYLARIQLRDISDGISLVASARAQSSGVNVVDPEGLVILATGLGYEHLRATAQTYAGRITTLDAIVGETDVASTHINANAPAVAVASLLAQQP